MNICFYPKVLWPMQTGQPANAEKIPILEKRMAENLNLIENIWLKEQPFLCGNEISVSDLVAACEIEQPSKKTLFNENYNFYFYIYF